MSDQREPVDYPDRVKNLQALLHQLALIQQQLQAAMAKFAPDFDRASFVAAWESADPDARNQARIVRLNADDLHNSLVTLLHTAARTARSVNQLVQRSEETPLDALQREGRLRQPERDSLELAKAVRDRSQHEYFDLHPDEVHGMVMSQVTTAPRLIARISAWIGAWPPP